MFSQGGIVPGANVFPGGQHGREWGETDQSRELPPQFELNPPEESEWGSAFLPLGSAEVHVWRCALDRPDAAVFQRHLADDEIRRMERFKMPFLRTRFAVARGALRVLAGKYLGVEPGELVFSYGEHGKPALENLPFNISHSGDLLLAAFALDSPIGLDIEQISERLHARDIARRYFREREIAELEAPDEMEFLRRFFRLWTAKEAVMKATSLGFALELSKIEISLSPLRIVSLDWDGPRDWDLHDVTPGEGFAGTLACRPGGVLRRFALARE